MFRYEAAETSTTPSTAASAAPTTRATMTPTQIDHCGFDADRHSRFPRRRATVVAQLVASLALVLSIAVLVTMVGLQAAVAAPLQHGTGGGLPIAGLVSLGLVAAGGLTVLIAGRGRALRPRD